MTGPLLRVRCPGCGLDFARRRDGKPFAHKCVDGHTPAGKAGRRRCPACGSFISRDPDVVQCSNCRTVWEAPDPRMT